MKHTVWLAALMVGTALPALAQTASPPKGKNASPAPSAAASKKTAAKAPAKAPVKAPVRTQAKPGAQRTATRKGVATKRRTPAAPARQLTPTPDRYREIQQALIDKGYLKSEATGQWDGQSADALRQFQIDQKMTPTGKINALSLIGLGLGPKTAGPLALPAPNQPAPGQAVIDTPVVAPAPAPEVQSGPETSANPAATH